MSTPTEPKNPLAEGTPLNWILTIVIVGGLFVLAMWWAYSGPNICKCINDASYYNNHTDSCNEVIGGKSVKAMARYTIEECCDDFPSDCGKYKSLGY